MKKVTVTTLIILVIFGIVWSIWLGYQGYIETGCFQKKIIDLDCGGAIPVFNCPHVVNVNWDEGKKCNTGRDCCSGKCQIFGNEKNCVTYSGCMGGVFIDREGNEQNNERCIR